MPEHTAQKSLNMVVAATGAEAGSILKSVGGIYGAVSGENVGEQGDVQEGSSEGSSAKNVDMQKRQQAIKESQNKIEAKQTQEAKYAELVEMIKGFASSARG